MKRTALIIGLSLLCMSCHFKPRATWVTTADGDVWHEQPELIAASVDSIPSVDVTIHTEKRQQQIDGFGACFNELGWISLSKLSPESREKIMEELFFPDFGANFNICRMPVGANDFSRDWYSYNETDSDFVMSDFTIANDVQTLVPFIKNAQKYNPDLKIWASPWCPPSWMKYNKHYASAYTDENVDSKYRNGLPKEDVGHEGTDMFVQDSSYLQAYALYFSKFISAYKEKNIPIFAVMPQNEFNSAQVFPSCCWKSSSLANFIGKYLGPAMKKQDVDVMFGTVERANEALVDTVLTDPEAAKYVTGVAFQWAGKGAVSGIHKRYPKMKLYQSEQECGNGKNDWQGAFYSWNLMRTYFDGGVSAYMYWNISLEKGGISRWGWAQNSLVVVDPASKSFVFTPEYYVMKHLSHYVAAGAYKVATSGNFNNLLAFVNHDGSVVVAMANENDAPQKLKIRIEGRVYQPVLPAHSITTLFVD